MTNLPFAFTYLLMKVLPQRLALAISAALAGLVTWLLFGWSRAEGHKIDSCNSISGTIGRLVDQGRAIGCEAAPILQVVAFILSLMAGLFFVLYAAALVYGLARPDFDFMQALDD